MGRVGYQHCNLRAAADWETRSNHLRWFILKGQQLTSNHYSTAFTQPFNFLAHSYSLTWDKDNLLPICLLSSA